MHCVCVIYMIRSSRSSSMYRTFTSWSGICIMQRRLQGTVLVSQSWHRLNWTCHWCMLLLLFWHC